MSTYFPKMAAVKLFENKKIRSVWDTVEEKWYFSIVDAVAILTDNLDAKDYWYRMKKREKLSGVELSTICRLLKMESNDGNFSPPLQRKKPLLTIGF